MRKLFSVSICLLFLLSAIAIAQEQPTSTRDAKGCYEQCGFGPYKDCLAQGGSEDECYKKAGAICEVKCAPYEEQPSQPPTTEPTPAQPSSTTQPTTPASTTTSSASCTEECKQEYDMCLAGGAPAGASDCPVMYDECTTKCIAQPSVPPTTATTQPTTPTTTPYQPLCQERCKEDRELCLADGNDPAICDDKYGRCIGWECKKAEEKPTYPTPAQPATTSTTPVLTCEESCHDIYSDEACLKQQLDSETCKNKRYTCLGGCEKKPEMYPGEKPTPVCPAAMPTSTCETTCSKMYYECSLKAKSFGGLEGQQASDDCKQNVGMCLDSCAPAMETATCENKCGKIKDYCAKEGIMEMTCGLKIDACLKECVSIKPRMTCEDSCISVKDECLNKGLDEMTCGEYVNTCLAQCSWQEQEYKKPENCKDLCTKYDASCLQGGNEPEACRIIDEACINSCETGNAQQIPTPQQEQVTVQVPANLWEKFKRWLGGQ